MADEPFKEDVLRQLRALSRRDQDWVVRNASQSPDDDRHGRWCTLGDAAAELGKHKSQVTRYVQDGRLRSNGATGRGIRVRNTDLAILLLMEATRILRKMRGVPFDHPILEILNAAIRKIKNLD
jgi:hypothetical protein